MGKSVLFNIYADLTTAMKNVVETKYIYLKDRPKVGDDDLPTKKFAVIDLPLNISDYVIGSKKTRLVTSGVFYLFTQSRDNGTLDVNIAGDFVDSVVGLFPIIGEYCEATDPVIQMTGNDGYGFQVTTVTFSLATKWRVFG